MIPLLLALALLQSPLESRIDELVPKLAAESLEERTSAAAALKELARSDPRASRPILRKRLQETADDEVKAGLRGVLDSLPKVDLRLAVKEPVTVGKPTAVQAWVRNWSEVEIVVPLPTLTSEVGFRYPKVVAAVVDPVGSDTADLLCAWRGVVPPPVPSDFVRVAPGAEVDLLASPGVRMESLKKWTPQVAGSWKIRLAFDWTAADNALWIAPEKISGSMDASVPDLIGRVPKEKLEASLEVRVTEK